MNGYQCDNCRSFVKGTAAGWLVLQCLTADTGLFGSPGSQLAGTFCSMKCLAEYAYAKAVIEDNGVEAGS